MESAEERGSTARRAAAAATGVVGGGAGLASLAGDQPPAPDAVLAAGDDVLGLVAPATAPPEVALGSVGAELGQEIVIARDIEVEALPTDPVSAPEPPADDPGLVADLDSDGAIGFVDDDPVAAVEEQGAPLEDGAEGSGADELL